MQRLQYTGNNNADFKFKNYYKRTEFSGSVSTSWCLSQILKVTFFLGFERGLYGVSGVSSGLFTLMGDTSRLFHKKATV